MIIKVVRELLTIQHKTMEQLAKHLKMSYVGLKKHEFYKYKKMSASNFVIMAKFLNVPFQFLERMYDYDNFEVKEMKK